VEFRVMGNPMLPIGYIDDFQVTLAYNGLVQAWPELIRLA